MKDWKKEIAKLTSDLLEAKREAYRLQFDREAPDAPGPPATPAQLASLERRLGRPLPPSYRAFLELHNGWESFDGDAKLLSVDDQESEWVKSAIENVATAFDEDEGNPFEAGAMPIMIGEQESNYTVMDPRKPKPDGELPIVTYDNTEKEDVFKNFADYLRDVLAVTREQIEVAKEGEEPEEDEE